MILKIKHFSSFIVKVSCEGNNQNLLKTERKNDFDIDYFEIQNSNNLIIEVYLTNKNAFKVTPFKKDWYDGIKSSMLSVDCVFKKQKWKIDYVSNRNACLEMTINSIRKDNILNGYIELINLSIDNSKNVIIKNVDCMQKNNKEKFIIGILMFVNLIPLILLILISLYFDIFHPEVFRSGTLYILIVDIPLIIVLIIYIIRYALYLHKL